MCGVILCVVAHDQNFQSFQCFFTILISVLKITKSTYEALKTNKSTEAVLISIKSTEKCCEAQIPREKSTEFRICRKRGQNPDPFYFSRNAHTAQKGSPTRKIRERRNLVFHNSLSHRERVRTRIFSQMTFRRFFF